jgi:PAS domain S-box-containing protein
MSEREELLVEAERIAHMGSWVWNIDEDQVFWSDELYRILGHDPERGGASTIKFFASIHPEDRSRVQARAAHAVASGAAQQVDFRLQRSDGHVRYVTMDGALLFDQAGVLRRVVGCVLDITEAREAARRVEHARSLLEEAQAIAHLGSWELTLADESVAWSAELYRILGMQPSDARRRGELLARVHPDDQAMFTALHEECVAQLRPVEGDARVLRANGELCYVRVKMIPHADEFGRCLGTRGTVLDVTDLRLLQKRLAQAEKMEAIGRLAGGIAHDFNNLLMVIQGNLSLLESPDEEGLDNISRAVKSAQQLTSGLLAFGRRSNLQRRAIELNLLVTRTIELVGRLLGETIVVQTELDRRLPALLLDEALTEQALVNLLINARDAMPDGGSVSVRTCALACDGASWVELSVSDTGSGIDDLTRERIFEPFFSTKPEGGGSGLGLAMVQGTVEQHGGCVLVESAPGCGSTFTLRFPVGAVEAPNPTPPAPIVATDPGKPSTILVVEDQLPVARVVGYLLERDGHRVIHASSPDQAFDVVAANAREIDLLLCDVMMPQMRGPALVEELERRGYLLRVLFMSGYPDEAVEPLRHPLLHKPFSPEELRIAVIEAVTKATKPRRVTPRS